MTEQTVAIENRPATRAQTIVMAIGARVRDQRMQQGLTLQQLSDAAGVSQSMLSLLERGKTTASIGTLMAVADALGVTMSDLLLTEEPAPARTVIRATEQPIYETEQGVTWRVVRQDRQRGLEIAINEYAPGTGSTRSPHHHRGYEYGLVLEGELTVEVDGTTHLLRRGDTVAFSSSSEHRIWNFGRAPARGLWIIVADNPTPFR